MAKQRTWSPAPAVPALGVLALPAQALAAEFSLEPDVWTVATNLVVFLILIYPVNKLLIAPLMRTLAERQARSEGADQRAAGLAEQARGLAAQLAEQLAEARTAAQTRRAAVLAEGRREEDRLLGRAREEALQTIEGVRGSVAEELTAARTTLEADALGLAREAAARILGRRL